jgi:hypothetical protein
VYEEHASHGQVAVVHTHVANSVLHRHRSNGVEVADSFEGHHGTYLNLFQVKVTSATLVELFLVEQRLGLEDPDTNAAIRAVLDFRNHDPPTVASFRGRAPPAYPA